MKLISSPAIYSLIENKDFYHYSQGLFSTHNWSKVGAEILFRSEIGTPDIIFREAKKRNLLYELETSSILKALETYNSQESTSRSLLFINIYPSTILHTKFPNFIKKLASLVSPNSQSIIFEIIETEQVKDIPFLKERIKLVKSLGYLIAIDDVGKGWSSLNMIIELEPQYIKLDHYFSIDLSKSLSKQEMIKALLQYAHYSSSKLVLEGIEQEADLAIAKYLGIHICQGFLLERPQPITGFYPNTERRT